MSVFLSNVVRGATEATSRSRALELNGLFALTTERDGAPQGYARKIATLFQLNDDGLIESMRAHWEMDRTFATLRKP